MKRLQLITCILLFSLNINPQNNTSLKTEIENFIITKKALVGVAAIYDSKDTLIINNTYQYPTLSVYKLHQTIAVLDYLEKNDIPLNHQILINKADLLPLPIYSPLRDKYPDGDVKLTLDELIRFNICLSDNSACDILFNLIGGIEVVDRYIKNSGIEHTSIGATEKTMNSEFNAQYLNWSTPLATAQLIEGLLNAKILSPSNTRYLKQVMIETPTGANKIKGLLPAGTIVGHKTGASFRNSYGMNLAENDAGFIILPNGKTISIVVFVANSLENQNINCEIIAQISKLIYEHYSKI